MSTLRQALDSDDREGRTQIACMIVSIHLFNTDRSILVTVVLMDKDGAIFEAKAWSPKKAYYIYFNFREGQCVLLNCSPAHFNKVDSRYSGARTETFQLGWMLEQNKSPTKQKHYFPVHTNISSFRGSRAPVKSILATFVKAGGGPRRYNEEGRLMARGHFTQFEDAKGVMFQVLLWENPNRKFPFPLKNCKEGEIILLPFLRELDARFRTPKIYTVTSLYGPVTNVECIVGSKILHNL